MNDAIKRYRARKKARLTERYRADETEDEGRWITTDNGHKVHLNEIGEPDKGNPHVTKNLGPDFGQAAKKIKDSGHKYFAIKITDKELKDGDYDSADDEFKWSSEGKGSRAILIKARSEKDIDEDYLRDYVKDIIEENGEEFKGKNVYLVGADYYDSYYKDGIKRTESLLQVRQNEDRSTEEERKGAEVLCKIFERGGDDEARVKKGRVIDEEATEKRYGDRRKQVSADSRAIRSDDHEELEKFNKKALRSIMEETGMKEGEARGLQACLNDYFGGNYLSYADGKKKKEVDTIDKGLSRMGAYDGEIWRGMRFRDESPEGAPDSAGIKAFMDLEVGDEIGMKSVSSWTSDKKIAEQFASLGSFAGQEKESSVMIRCKKNKTSVGIQHVSRFRGEEKEVLAKSTTKWRVTGKKIMTVYDYMSQVNSNWKDLIDRYFKKYGDIAKSHYVVTIDVEEI